MNRPILVFEVGERLCGVDATVVLEVVRAVAIEPLLGAPQGVEGVIDARGEIVPVIGMRTRLGLVPLPNDSSQYFILAEAGARRVALRVDRVLDLQVIEVKERETMGLEETATVGVARFSDGLIFIHDLGACLDVSEERLLAALLSEREQGAWDENRTEVGAASSEPASPRPDDRVTHAGG